MTKTKSPNQHSWIALDARPYDQMLFSNDLVAAGEFNCSDDRDEFADCGPIRNVQIVFPRSCVRIVGTGTGDFVSTPTRLNIYGRGATFNRVSVANQSDHGGYLSFRAGALDRLTATGLYAAEAFPVPCASKLYLRQRNLIDSLKSGLFSTSIAAEEAVMELATSQISDIFPLAGAAYRRFMVGAEEELSRTRINKIIEYSAMPETQSWGLVDYARAVEVSPWHVSRVFKRHTGLGFQQFIMNQRLRQSLEMLRSRNATVTAVAHDLGFSSHSHFTSAFKIAFSLTPSEFIRGRRLSARK